MQGLHRQWLVLWSKLGGKGKGMVPFTDLLSRYNEPWRAYHTLRHIQMLLAEFELFRFSNARPSWLNDRAEYMAIEMAIWYHDVVYSTQAKDNEERSAQLFRAVAKTSGLRNDLAEKVVRMIEATKHVHAPSDLNAQVLCDIDLAILGQPEEDFDEYERQIRKEYEWVPEEQFREGRAKILLSFLDRRLIYSTGFFQQKYETKARRNLARSIEKLSK